MFFQEFFRNVKYNLQGVWGGRDVRFKKRARPIYPLPIKICRYISGSGSLYANMKTVIHRINNAGDVFIYVFLKM